MTDSMPEPVILDSISEMVYRGMSALAGMQLDLFTPLRLGPLSADEIATSLGLEVVKLRPMLYSLVVVGLLTVEDGLFAKPNPSKARPTIAFGSTRLTICSSYDFFPSSLAC